MNTEKKTLTEAERVTAVLNAAGRSTRLAAHLPEKYQKQLAALCSVEGVPVVAVRDKVVSILGACGREQKANLEAVEGEE